MKDILKLAFALMIFAAAACVALALVYDSTAEIIAGNQNAKLEKALADIFGAGASFARADTPESGDSAVTISAAWTVKNAAGKVTGAAVTASSQGFNDALTALVGVGADGKIQGVRILKDTDTPGLGANAASAAYFVDKPENRTTFYGQFSGMAADGAIKVKKDGGAVEAVTAATITSRAVALIVNTAALAAKKLAGGAA